MMPNPQNITNTNNNMIINQSNTIPNTTNPNPNPNVNTNTNINPNTN